MSEPTADAGAIEEYAATQGLRVDDSGGLRRSLRWFASFMAQKRLGAAGLLLVVFWSIIAIGTVGDGGGWLGIGRYDSRDVFEIASVTYADDKIANALDGLDEKVSGAELRELVSDAEIYGAVATDQGVADAMIVYAQDQVDQGTLLETLLDAEQIEIRDGVIYDVDALLATGTDNPLTAASLQGPSGAHWLGTDRAGHDLFSRVTEGARLSLYIGFFATLIGVGVGTVIGLVAGSLGGSVDLTVNRIMDAIQSYPPIVFLLLIASLTDPSALWVTLALSVLGVAPTNRIVRGSVIQIREMPYVEAARTIGASSIRVMVFHILPNLFAPLIVIFSITIGAFILAEA
ncbi:MAG: ABC transporter permease, partial [Chloroflexi bacterium]|nr:ABC transporter permease [Chloroflexota bacterium]